MSQRKLNQRKRIKKHYIEQTREGKADLTTLDEEALSKACKLTETKGEGYEIGELEQLIIRKYVFYKDLKGYGNGPSGRYKTLFNEMLVEMKVPSEEIPIIDKIKVYCLAISVL